MTHTCKRRAGLRQADLHRRLRLLLIMTPTAAFRFDNSYARELPGCYAAGRPAPAPEPRLLFLNRTLAQALGLDDDALDGPAGAALFAGNALPEGAQPIAQAYAGHQFGGFSPQLGDGRALLIGEVIDRQGQRHDIAFKGSGRTAYSRGGDGKAAVGPMLREVLIGEAMHALGIPTTRALAVAATGEQVWRERALPGAVLTRVASSHLRVGTFQYFAARDDTERLQRLLDYAIARHDPALADAPQPALALLQAVAGRQARLVAQWMNVGFIHGVMNTDNMTISGETIDYGPCAFMEAYDPETVFSSIDHQGRYAYGNQPRIAQWNLARLAEALLPLILPQDHADDEAAVERAVADATAVIESYPRLFDTALRAGQRAKLGLRALPVVTGEDPAATLADDWLALLHRHQVDHTLGWRHLADAAAGDETPVHALFSDPAALQPWLVRWRALCAADDTAITSGGGASPSAARPLAGEPASPAHARAEAMRAVNPWIIPRNHRVEEALAAASEHGDLGPFERLLAALRQPWTTDSALARYAEPAPRELTERYRTFCGT
jgi:uncharacterized protein YdiU (UPF0061 family)